VTTITEDKTRAFFIRKRLQLVDPITTVYISSHTKGRYSAGVTERSDSRRIVTPGSFFYVEM
jgi:Iap family predicted aminopeptidase